MEGWQPRVLLQWWQLRAVLQIVAANLGLCCGVWQPMGLHCRGGSQGLRCSSCSSSLAALQVWQP